MHNDIKKNRDRIDIDSDTSQIISYFIFMTLVD